MLLTHHIIEADWAIFSGRNDKYRHEEVINELGRKIQNLVQRL